LIEGWFRQSNDLSDQSYLLIFVFTTKYGVAEFEFCCNTGKRPDIDFSGVVVTEDNLRSSVVPRLDVGIELLIAKAARPEIDNLDARLIT